MDLTVFLVCFLAVLVGGATGFYALARLARRPSASFADDGLAAPAKEMDNAASVLASVPPPAVDVVRPEVAAPPVKRVIKLVSPKPEPVASSAPPVKRVLSFKGAPAPSSPSPSAATSPGYHSTTGRSYGGGDSELFVVFVLGLGVLGLLVLGAAAAAANSSNPKSPPLPPGGKKW